ncbi:MAG: NmrA family NAD(P)-binding protein [Rhodanobacter sp.]
MIAVAGASGDLGGRITKALVSCGAVVRALVRPDSSPKTIAQIESLGAVAVKADPAQIDELAEACSGASCVVSALNGLHEVIVERQSKLLQAAMQAGVQRFISSDYSEDFTRTAPGGNRNLDLRREFMQLADRSPIKVTSILNGAFMDMLGADMPIIQRRWKRVLYWQDPDQLLDFTTKEDVAGFTARAALENDTPRILRIAGDSVSARQIADMLSESSRQHYRPLKVGGVRSLGWLINLAKLLTPTSQEPFPVWQGMQYMRDMFSGDGKIDPVDNKRYADLRWTKVAEQIQRLF